MANRTYNALSPRNAYQLIQSQPPIQEEDPYLRQPNLDELPDQDEPQQQAAEPDLSDLPDQEDYGDMPTSGYNPNYSDLPWLNPKNTDPFKPKSYDALGTNLGNEVPETPSLSGSMYGDSSFNYQNKPSSFEDIHSTNPDDYEQSDAGFSLKTLKDQFTWPNAARMGISTAGDIAGAATGGLLYYPISAAAGGLGEFTGQVMEGKSPWDVNYAAVGTEALLNPLTIGPSIPKAGQGLRGAIKFIGGAAEAGGKNALVGINPRKWANEGFFDNQGKFNYAGLDETAGQVGVGTLMGGATGALMHGATSAYRAGRAGPTPFDVNNMKGKYTVDETVTPKWPDFDPNAETVTRETPQLKAGPEPVVTLQHPDMASIQAWRDQGYVAVDRSPEGYFRMARADVADQYIAPIPDTPPTANEASFQYTDPNFNPGGAGDAEMAGSSPYGKAPDIEGQVLQGEILPPEVTPEAPPAVEPVPPVQRVGNQTEIDRNEDWTRSQRNLSVYEGKTDPVIKASYDKMQEVRNAYAEWISQQEELLGPGEIFTPPPEVREAYLAQMEQMEDAHQAVINSRGGFEQGRPPDIEGEALPNPFGLPVSSVGVNVPTQAPVTPTVQLPPGFTPPPPQDPFIQDLKARMKYLDGRKVPDEKYKPLALKISAEPLKKRETWRSRLAKGIREAEKGPGKIEKGGPGSADVSNTYTQLERMLGRPPTTEEIDAAAARQAGVGDQTGQVAQFPESLGQMAHRLVQEEAANPAPYFALDSTHEFAERVGKIQSIPELDRLREELRAGIEAARQSDMPPAARVAYYDLMGILDRRRVVLSPTGQLDRTLSDLKKTQDWTNHMARAGNIPVRVPGREGNVEWPPKSGTVQQPTYQPTEVYEQPGLPFGPVAANPNPPPMGIGDMRAQQGVQNITPPDPNQVPLPLTTDYNHPKEGGPGSADINKAFLEFIQREGRDPTDDELVNLTWGAEQSLNMAPPTPTTSTGMMAGPQIDLSSYGPKGQEYIQWLKDTGSLWNPNEMDVAQKIEFDGFVRSLDWEEDPNQMPAVRPQDVDNAVRDTTLSDARVMGNGGLPLNPTEERNVGRTEPLPPEVPIPPIARITAKVTDISALSGLDNIPITDETKVVIRATMDRINETKTVAETNAMMDDLDRQTEIAIDEGDRDSAEIYSELAHYAAQRVVNMSRESIASLNLDPDVASQIDNDQAVIFRASMDKVDAADTVAKAQENYTDLLRMGNGLTQTHPRLAHIANKLANYAGYKLTQLEKEAAEVGPETPIESADMPIPVEPTFRRSIAKPGEQQDLPEMGLQEKKPYDVAKGIEEWEDAQETPGFHKIPSKKLVDPDTGMTERDLVDQRNIIRNAQMDAAHGITEGDFTPEFLEKAPHYKDQFKRIVGWNAGAVDVELKDGRVLITDRGNVTSPIPNKKSWTSHPVMNPERFDKNGKFIGSAKPEPDLGSLPDQEPLPLSTDLEHPPELEGKNYGPGAAMPGDISGKTNDEIWMEMLEELGRPPTQEEYLAFLRNGPTRTPPRNLAERAARRKEVVQKLDFTFEEAKGYGATDFILPNGKLLAHGDITHNRGAMRAGTSLNEVLNSGVVRFASNSAETNGPITGAQAAHIAQAGADHRHERAYVDINLPGGDIVSRTFVDRTLKGSAIQQWVNSHFPNEGMKSGEQQILPGVPQGHIPPADVLRSDVEIFKGAGQLQLPYDHPTIAKFREGLKETNSPWDAHFVLPDGVALTGGSLKTHPEIAAKLGFNHQEVLKDGLMRVRYTSAEISSPISIAQARYLIDARKTMKNNHINVDVNLPEHEVVGKSFDARAKASTIYNWVKQQFKDLAKDETGAMPVPQWAQNAANKAKNKTRQWGWGQGRVNANAPPPGQPQPYSKVHEAMQVPKNAMTAGDASFLMRQGAGAILYKPYWKALSEIPQSMTTAGAAAIHARNEQNPIYQRPLSSTRTRQHPNGVPLPSIAEKMGVELYDDNSAPVGNRAQAVASKWLEEGIGQGRGSKLWSKTAGKFYRISNRMHRTFLNTVKTGLAQDMTDYAATLADSAARQASQSPTGTAKVRPGLMNRTMTAQEAAELHPWLNDQLAREIGDWVNTATGSAPLKAHILPFDHKYAQLDLEDSAALLNRTMFASGLAFSRLRMTSPATYVMATPMVRKQYMRSLLGHAAAWTTMITATKLAADALGIDNEINFNPTSADFGKIRFGKVRLDPGQGMLQFLVLYGRHLAGGHTTASSDEFKKFGEEYRGETHGSNLLRFGSNKLEPITKFAYDFAFADKNNPFHVGDRIIQLAVALYIQDLWELSKEDPKLFAPLAGGAFIGGGTQIYDRNESKAKFIPEEYDYVYRGDKGIRNLMPWNWGEQSDEYQGPPNYKIK